MGISRGMHWDVHIKKWACGKNLGVLPPKIINFHGIYRFTIINYAFWDTPTVGKLQTWAHGTWTLLFSPHFIIKNFGPRANETTCY